MRRFPTGWSLIGRFVAIPVAITLIAGCAGSKPKASVKKVQLPSTAISVPAGMPAGEASKYNELLKEIAERNTNVEDDPLWIQDSYKSFLFKKLREVPSRNFPKYTKYLDNGDVYIIVHPAYTTFFNSGQKKKAALAGQEDFSDKNAVELFLDKPANTLKMALVQAQERQIRDFLELKSSEKKLIIVIFEKEYQNRKNYAFKGGRDEFMRFINEATNESEAVLYMESRKDGGALLEEDRVALQEFLLGVKAQRMLLAGSYLGRCVEDFYNTFTRDFGDMGVSLIPELTAVSPVDVPERGASMLIRKDGGLNVEAAAEYIKSNAYGNLDKVPEIITLKSLCASSEDAPKDTPLDK